MFVSLFPESCDQRRSARSSELVNPLHSHKTRFETEKDRTDKKGKEGGIEVRFRMK